VRRICMHVNELHPTASISSNDHKTLANVELYDGLSSSKSEKFMAESPAHK
jgi:hypothetical protein